LDLQGLPAAAARAHAQEDTHVQVSCCALHASRCA
jgi:hypothetical protein